MGILDRFRKQEYYNKETGRFEPVRREIRELTYEEQMEPPRRPSRWDEYSARRKQEKQIYKQEFQKARERGLRERARKTGFQSGRTSGWDRLQSFAGPPPRPTYKPRKKKKRKTTTRPKPYRIQDNYNPFGSTFDTGLQSFDPIDNYGFMKTPTTRRRKRKKTRR